MVVVVVVVTIAIAIAIAIGYSQSDQELCWLEYFGNFPYVCFERGLPSLYLICRALVFVCFLPLRGNVR